MGHFCLHLHILPRQFRSRLVILVFLSSSLSLTPFPHPTFLPFSSAFYCKTGIRLSVSYYSLLRSHFSVFLILTCLMPIFLRNNPFISLPNSHLFLFIPIFLLISILLFSSLSLFRLLFFIVHPHPLIVGPIHCSSSSLSPLSPDQCLLHRGVFIYELTFLLAPLPLAVDRRRCTNSV